MTDESCEIIRMLRDARLAWIADELVEALALGRQTTKAFREPGTKRATKASAVEPYSPDEEMALIIETLAQYFIVMPSAWKIARACFNKADTFTELQIVEKNVFPNRTANVGDESFATTIAIETDAQATFDEFSQGFLNSSLPAITTALSQLWPKGAEDFKGRFVVEEGSSE